MDKIMNKKMNSRDRIQAAWRGEPQDYVPLTTWCFGLKAPAHLKWQRNGQDVDYWFTKRLEHIHTFPQSWELEDDFQRALAWQSIGVDDILDVSIPWSIDPNVSWTETLAEVGALDPQYPVRVREYKTPSGQLRHAVKQTKEEQEPGWVIQPQSLPLFEDFNIPRSIKQAVSDLSDISAVRHLYRPDGWVGLDDRRARRSLPRHGSPQGVWSIV
jgi:hypothetical protein